MQHQVTISSHKLQIIIATGYEGVLLFQKKVGEADLYNVNIYIYIYILRWEKQKKNEKIDKIGTYLQGCGKKSLLPLYTHTTSTDTETQLLKMYLNLHSWSFHFSRKFVKKGCKLNEHPPLV